jgi:formylglycine-generating enzyme required for sulfatase activity
MADQHVHGAHVAANGNVTVNIERAAPDLKSQRLRYYQALAKRSSQPSAVAAQLEIDPRAIGAKAHEFYIDPMVSVRLASPAQATHQRNSMQHHSDLRVRADIMPSTLSNCLEGNAKDTEVANVLKTRAFLLVGNGGMGKTTAINQLAWLHCSERPQALGLGAHGGTESAAPLVLLRLPKLAEHLAAGAEPADAVLAALQTDIQDGLQCEAAVAKELVEQITGDLRKQPGLMLFDALDEVADTQRNFVLEAVLAFVRTHKLSSQEMPHTVVVSGRPYAFDQLGELASAFDRQFTRLDLLPLNPEHQHDFIVAYFSTQEGRERQGYQLPTSGQRLVSLLNAETGFRELAQTPLVLWLLCVLASKSTQALPRSRAALLERVLKLWLEEWDPQRDIAERLTPTQCTAIDAHRTRILEALQATAARAYEAESSRSPTHMPEAGFSIPIEALVVELDSCLPHVLPVRAHAVARLLTDRSMVVDVDGPNLVFAHGFFREFLAAQNLWRKLGAQPSTFAREVVERLCIHAGSYQSWSRMALEFLAQKCRSDQATADVLIDALTRFDALTSFGMPLSDACQVEPTHDATGSTSLLPSDASEDPASYSATTRKIAFGWVIVAEALSESWAQNLSARTANQLGSALRLLAFNSILPAAWRERAALALQAIGLDVRFSPQAPHLPVKRSRVWDGHNWRFSTEQEEPVLGFVRVPAGPYTRGGKDYPDDPEDFSTAIPHHYYVSRYLTTVDQFQAFIDAGGYVNQHWWDDAGWEWLQDTLADGVRQGAWEHHLQSRKAEQRLRPLMWAEQKTKPNHPVSGINWFEGRAYARWLTIQLRAELVSNGLHDFQVALPTEDQWERSARSASIVDASSRKWPWGIDATDWDKQREITFCRANTATREFGNTTTVGIFEANPLGLYDLAGNLWEWQANLFDRQRTKGQLHVGLLKAQRFDTQVKDAPFDITVKGGSWQAPYSVACCTYRHNLVPIHAADTGLRVVISRV